MRGRSSPQGRSKWADPRNVKQHVGGYRLRSASSTAVLTVPQALLALWFLCLALSTAACSSDPECPRGTEMVSARCQPITDIGSQPEIPTGTDVVSAEVTDTAGPDGSADSTTTHDSDTPADGSTPDGGDLSPSDGDPTEDTPDAEASPDGDPETTDAHEHLRVAPTDRRRASDPCGPRLAPDVVV